MEDNHLRLFADPTDHEQLGSLRHLTGFLAVGRDAEKAPCQRLKGLFVNAQHLNDDKDIFAPRSASRWRQSARLVPSLVASAQ